MVLSVEDNPWHAKALLYFEEAWAQEGRNSITHHLRNGHRRILLEYCRNGVKHNCYRHHIASETEIYEVSTWKSVLYPELKMWTKWDWDRDEIYYGTKVSCTHWLAYMLRSAKEYANLWFYFKVLQKILCTFLLISSIFKNQIIKIVT